MKLLRCNVLPRKSMPLRPPPRAFPEQTAPARHSAFVREHSSGATVNRDIAAGFVVIKRQLIQQDSADTPTRVCFAGWDWNPSENPS